MNKLYLILSAFAFSFGASAQVNLDSNLVACYGFNGSAADQTGNGNNGIVNGASLTTDRFGNPNSAYNFVSASSNYIDLTNDFDFQERSVNIWFNASSITASSKVIYDSDHPNLQHGETKIRVLDTGGPTLRMSVSNNTTIVDYPITANQWHMVTITVSTSTITYYVDGTQVGQTAYVWAAGDPVGNSTVPLGASRLLDRFFDGKIDDIRIYDRAITLAEVQALYNDSTCSTCISAGQASNLTNGIEACYPFSTNANDLSGNNNDGTVNGAALTTDRFGNPSSAYEFNSLFNQHIDLNNDFDFPKRTVNLWFNATSITGTSKVIYDSDHPNLQYGETKMRVLDNGGPILRYSVSNNTTVFDQPIVANQWYMATITVDSTSFKYYLDGCLVGEFAYVWAAGDPTGNSTVPLGASRLLDRFFDGKIDDVTIYSRALNGQEVSDLYNNGIPCNPIGIVESDLENQLELYPNPANNVVNIVVSEGGMKQIVLMNSLGQTVFVGQSLGKNKFSLDVNHLAKGMYLLQVKKANDQVITRKLMIE